jgi:hypothetical protein
MLTCGGVEIRLHEKIKLLSRPFVIYCRGIVIQDLM